MSANEFAIFFGVIVAVILMNCCGVRIEMTKVKTDEPRKMILEGHEYWASGTNITHSASCPCGWQSK